MSTKRSMEDLQRMSPSEFREAQKIPLWIVLDQVRSGLNVGSVFRTADAFRVAGIYCCGYTPAPPHREVLKSALGATETVDWVSKNTTEEAIFALQNDGIVCYAVEQVNGSVDLENFNPDREKGIAVVFGNEVDGVSQSVVDMCDGTLEISQFGTKHSLNVSVCAGIVIYRLFHQLR